MGNSNYFHDISAVLVTHNPNINTLHDVIRAVITQVSNLFIVDNASSNFSQEWLIHFKDQTNKNLHLIQQKENLGIGAGHNIGIQCAIKQGSKFVLLLDQDSQISQNMVSKLRFGYSVLEEKGLKVAAIGPQYRDADNGRLSQFVKVGLLGSSYCECKNDTSFIDSDFLVSSGSLLSITALSTIGLMDEKLFIDHVDTEWCFRAKAKGFHIFGACGAVMTHTLGEQRKEIYFLRKRIVPFHKPFRYYYMFRNSVLLYRRKYMPWRWKFSDVIRCLKIMIFFSCFGKDRLACLTMMWLGIIDGLKGISGKRDYL